MYTLSRRRGWSLPSRRRSVLNLRTFRVVEYKECLQLQHHVRQITLRMKLQRGTRVRRRVKQSHWTLMDQNWDYEAVNLYIASGLWSSQWHSFLVGEEFSIRFFLTFEWVLWAWDFTLYTNNLCIVPEDEHSLNAKFWHLLTLRLKVIAFVALTSNSDYSRMLRTMRIQFANEKGFVNYAFMLQTQWTLVYRYGSRQLNRGWFPSVHRASSDQSERESITLRNFGFSVYWVFPLYSPLTSPGLALFVLCSVII